MTSVPHSAPTRHPHRATMQFNPWFAGIPRGNREALLSAAEPLHLRPGAMLFRKGDPVGAPGSGFFGLAAGALKTSTLRGDGREAILGILEPGNWFGEVSLIDGAPRTHDAIAIGMSTVLVVSPAVFQRQMRDAVFANAIAQLLATRVRALYGMIEDSALRGLRARVASRLILLARGGPTLLPQARNSIALSQEMMAMMLGISRQTLSIELNALVRDGVIALGYRRIDIVSMEALQAAAR